MDPRKLLIAVRPNVEMFRVPSFLPQQLQAQFPQLQVTSLDGYADIDRHLREAEIFVGWTLPAEKLAIATRLKWMHSIMTGVTQLCYPEMVSSPVVLTNAATVHSIPVAEHAWALILASARRLPSVVRYQQTHEWATQKVWDETPRPFEVNGLTLGLVGLGAIGGEVALRAKAFGMRVIAVRRHPARGHEFADEVFGVEELPRLLRESHVVVLAAPSTPHTERLFGEREFAMMKPSALLVNVSRGSLLDEAALARALREHGIGGAALDVTATEPLPADSPLWDAPNCLVSPHLSSATERLWPRHLELLAENVRRYLAGQPLLNVVDKASGY